MKNAILILKFHGLGIFNREGLISHVVSFLVKGQFLPMLFASLQAKPVPTIPHCTTVMSE